jgi:glutaminyl-peptide cyclotransferase
MGRAGMFLKRIIFFTALCAGLAACSDHPKEPTPETPANPTPAKPVLAEAPAFNADSAYEFTKRQVDFGPRTLKSKAHENCAQYFIARLKAYGLKVQVQEGIVKNYEGKSFPFKNITGSFHPENNTRIAVFCHWDSRNIADQDSIRKTEPIDGADDGASGCAVMLEIARDLQSKNPAVGVDVIFLDAEDTGQPEGTDAADHQEDTWCLGSQYWSKHLPDNYAPRLGILLDMVGAKGASFPMEGESMQYAPDLVRKVWGIANDLGYSGFFTYKEDGFITDDHVYINRDAKIPTVDIINYDREKGGFGFYHHRHSDNMNIIDKTTLQAVGQTVLQVIYSEVP